MSGLPDVFFHSLRYLRSTARRLEHLATLDLPIASKSVLEIGAGIGDLTSFFLDRDCTVTSTEPRAPNIARLRERYAEEPLWPTERLRIIQSDIEHLAEHDVGIHDIVFAYGVLNEVPDPGEAIAALARQCGEMLLLEVAVNRDLTASQTMVYAGAPKDDLRATISGRQSISTRASIVRELRARFPYVYAPRVRPAHDRFDPEFPENIERSRYRIMLVASRIPLDEHVALEAI